MTLSAAALTTLAVVLDELDIEDDAGVIAARVERYIESASAFCVGVCGRAFHRQTLTERVRGFGHPCLLVKQTPIFSVTSIAYDEDAFSADTYEVDDVDVGVIRRLGGVWPDTAFRSGDLVPSPIPGTERGAIIVTYVAGWVTPAQAEADAELTRDLPVDLEDAVVQLAVSRYRRRGRDARLATESLNSSTYSYDGLPVPADIAAVLSRYARIAHA